MTELAPRRDAWGLPTCFHRIECPVSTCEWRNSRLEGFVSVAIEELEDHLWQTHRSKVHLTAHGSPDRKPLAHSIRCEVFGAIFDEGLLTDGELNIRVTHHRVAQQQRTREST